ncbi:MAG: DUF3717 domain-containing protein [Burkholderiales bacterium]|nr:DUF3717 domain-containing protein [Burkholderiales bacterium]
MAGIHITDIEAAINYWRDKKPSSDGITLAPEVRALAEVYALMVFWTEMRPAQKRQTWRRITLSGQAWRFNRYAERAGGSASDVPLAQAQGEPA